MRPHEEESEPTTYVNQFKLRTVYGKTFLLNFFLNSGSLSGSELMRLRRRWACGAAVVLWRRRGEVFCCGQERS